MICLSLIHIWMPHNYFVPNSLYSFIYMITYNRGFEEIYLIICSVSTKAVFGFTSGSITCVYAFFSYSSFICVSRFTFKKVITAKDYVMIFFKFVNHIFVCECIQDIFISLVDLINMKHSRCV